MGLEIVELILAVEAAFEIQIPDADIETIVLVGGLYDCVLHRLRLRGEEPDEKLVWAKLHDVIVAQLGVRPEEVIRTAHLIDDLGAD